MKRILFISLSIFSCGTSYEEGFYQDGQLEYRVPVKEGVREGELKKYYPNGQLQYVSNWSGGIKEGPAKLYYQNGTIHVEESFVNGKPHGTIKEYDSLGKVLRVMEFFRGEKKNETSYFTNGELEGKIVIRNDTVFSNYYHENGSLDEISVRVGGSLIYGKKFNLQGDLLSSNIPIVSYYSRIKNDVVLTVELTYSSCSNCTFLVILGEVNDQFTIEDELYRKRLDSRRAKFTIDKEMLGNNNIEGLFYELDSNDVVKGFSPFKAIADL